MIGADTSVLGPGATGVAVASLAVLCLSAVVYVGWQVLAARRQGLSARGWVLIGGTAVGAVVLAVVGEVLGAEPGIVGVIALVGVQLALRPLLGRRTQSDQTLAPRSIESASGSSPAIRGVGVALLLASVTLTAVAVAAQSGALFAAGSVALALAVGLWVSAELRSEWHSGPRPSSGPLPTD